MGRSVRRAKERAEYSASKVLRLMCDWSCDFQSSGQSLRLMMYPVRERAEVGSRESS